VLKPASMRLVEVHISSFPKLPSKPFEDSSLPLQTAGGMKSGPQWPLALHLDAVRPGSHGPLCRGWQTLYNLTMSFELLITHRSPSGTEPVTPSQWPLTLHLDAVRPGSHAGLGGSCCPQYNLTMPPKLDAESAEPHNQDLTCPVVLQ
jgi:hypothetical protein